MKNKKTLIISGLGLNCEKETLYSCEQSGGKEIIISHMNDFLNGDVNLKAFNFIIFMGGFLDGDYLGSARVGANRFKFSDNNIIIKHEFNEFIDKGNLILGICNGFQLLIKLGFLPNDKLAFKGQTVSLTHNKKCIFENRWVYLKVNPKNNNIFTKNIDVIYLPIRHGEGQIVVNDKHIESNIIKNNNIAMSYAYSDGTITDKYPYNPNGSWQNIAALSNSTGNILGLMPHPEAFNHYTNHPHWTRFSATTEDGDGLKIFKNAYEYLNNRQ